MSSATQLNLSSSTADAPENPNQAAPVTLQSAQAHFELGVGLSLALWPALTLAVQNSWGGPDSADKRDWFGGAIVDLFQTRADTILEDVESMLLQVMEEEFDVVVDDDSAFEVAEEIMKIRGQCGKGEFALVTTLQEKWERRGGNKAATMFQKGQDEDQSTDGSDFEGFSDDEDVEMGGVPLSAPKQKVEPEIDEDGFTKVVGKKKR